MANDPVHGPGPLSPPPVEAVRISHPGESRDPTETVESRVKPGMTVRDDAHAVTTAMGRLTVGRAAARIPTLGDLLGHPLMAVDEGLRRLYEVYPHLHAEDLVTDGRGLTDPRYSFHPGNFRHLWSAAVARIPGYPTRPLTDVRLLVWGNGGNLGDLYVYRRLGMDAYGVEYGGTNVPLSRPHFPALMEQLERAGSFLSQDVVRPEHLFPSNDRSHDRSFDVIVVPHPTIVEDTLGQLRVSETFVHDIFSRAKPGAVVLFQSDEASNLISKGLIRTIVEIAHRMGYTTEEFFTRHYPEYTAPFPSRYKLYASEGHATDEVIGLKVTAVPSAEAMAARERLWEYPIRMRREMVSRGTTEDHTHPYHLMLLPFEEFHHTGHPEVIGMRGGRSLQAVTENIRHARGHAFVPDGTTILRLALSERGHAGQGQAVILVEPGRLSLEVINTSKLTPGAGTLFIEWLAAQALSRHEDFRVVYVTNDRIRRILAGSDLVDLSTARMEAGYWKQSPGGVGASSYWAEDSSHLLDEDYRRRHLMADFLNIEVPYRSGGAPGLAPGLREVRGARTLRSVTKTVVSQGEREGEVMGRLRRLSRHG